MEAVLGSHRRRSTRFDKPPKPRREGGLTVRPLKVTTANDWTPCDVPGCMASADGNQSRSHKGRRVAAVQLYSMGKSLGCYCESHGRELRGVWRDITA